MIQLSTAEHPTNNYARKPDGELVFFNDASGHQVDRVIEELSDSLGKLCGSIWRDPEARRAELVDARMITVCEGHRHTWFKPKETAAPHCSRCGVRQ